MILEDFHVHTCFCDGKKSPEEMVLAAISKGMTKINNFSLSHRGYQDIYLKLRQLNIEFEVNYN